MNALTGGLLACASLLGALPVYADDPLPSSADGAATTPGSPSFVPGPERVVAFCRDGALGVEHPGSAQVESCPKRVPAVVEARPELRMGRQADHDLWHALRRCAGRRARAKRSTGHAKRTAA